MVFIDSAGLTVYVLKGLSFFASFLLTYLLISSVTRTRRDLELFVRVLVVGAAIVGFFSIIEYRTGFNVFDHLASVFPFLHYNGLPQSLAEFVRSGRLRVFASSQHPIALAALLVMLIPLGLYLALSTRRLLWWAATFLIGIGALTTLSRTAITMALAAGIVLFVLRPRETKRLLPLLLPAVIAVFLVLPQALGTFEGVFFPKGGIITDQSSQGYVGNGHRSGRLATLGPALEQWQKHPFAGQGFSTQIDDPTDPRYTNSNVLDDQWLDLLLQTGALGIAAFVWVLARPSRRLGRLARSVDSSTGFLAGALAASILSFAVGMLTFDAFSFIQVTFIFFAVLALSGSLLVIARNDAGGDDAGRAAVG